MSEFCAHACTQESPRYCLYRPHTVAACMSLHRSVEREAAALASQESADGCAYCALIELMSVRAGRERCRQAAPQQRHSVDVGTRQCLGGVWRGQPLPAHVSSVEGETCAQVYAERKHVCLWEGVLLLVQTWRRQSSACTRCYCEGETGAPLAITCTDGAVCVYKGEL